MTVKQNRLMLSFDEQDEDFIRKFAGDIGCRYSKANERTYNLNKFSSNIQAEMGVFAWVHKENKDCFWVSTRKNWVEKAKAMVLAGKKQSDINCFPRTTLHAEDSVYLDTTAEYQKTVTVLNLIQESR